MGNPLFIGIDLGTTNGKVACYDSHGQLQAEAKNSYPTSYPRPGWVEQDPNDWTNSLQSGFKKVVISLGDRAIDVAGISVSTYGPGCVLIDDNGNPMSPSPTWQDRRCFPQGEKLVEAVGLNWIGYGAPLSAFPAKLLWVIEEEPDLVAQAAMISPIKGFLLNWLTGNSAVDPSSGPGALNWWSPAYEFAGWDIENLPKVLSATESPGNLRKEIAEKVGLRHEIPIFTGLNDGAAATLGSGAVKLGDSVITIATNGAARVLLSERVDPEIVYDRCLFNWPYLEGLWVCGGITYSGASSLQWLADQFGIPRDPISYDALLAEVEEVPVGSKGVLFIPYLGGRGTPQADPAQRGGFLNLSLIHGRPEITRSLLEGVTFAIREIYEEFNRLGFEIGALKLTGGGIRSELWRQIIVDVINREASFAGGDSTLGNAIIAAVGSGFYQDFDEASRAMVREISHEVPVTSHVDDYEQLYRSYKEARDTIVKM